MCHQSEHLETWITIFQTSQMDNHKTRAFGQNFLSLLNIAPQVEGIQKEEKPKMYTELNSLD